MKGTPTRGTVDFDFVAENPSPSVNACPWCSSDTKVVEHQENYCWIRGLEFVYRYSGSETIWTGQVHTGRPAGVK